MSLAQRAKLNYETKLSMKLNWDFLGEGGCETKKTPSMGEIWIFSGSAHFIGPFFQYGS